MIIFKLNKTLILLLTILITSCNQTTHKIITNCYDGDTCYYKENPKAQSIPIRLMNIDTPEIKGECQEEITKAIKARDRVNQLIRDSRNIKVDIYYTDKYNRYVGYIWLDSINLNTILLGEELAKPYKRNIDWCK